jgi:hypothetical protein
MPCVNSILVEEKSSANETLSEEVGCESCKPPEQVEAGAGLEHEECYGLLHEQAKNDSPPLDVGSMSRRGPKAELEDQQAQHGDRAVAISRILF